MKKSEIKKLDKLWSENVRKFGKCEKCGAKSYLQAHHFWGRRARSTRWSLENGFCLCPNCHKFSTKFSAHETPARFDDWAKEYRGLEWYDKLERKQRKIVKDQDFETIRKELKNG